MGSESKSPSWSSCGPVVLVAEEAGRDQASKGQRRNFQGSEPTAHSEAAGRRFLPLAAWCPGRPSRNEVTRGSGECALPDRCSPRVRLYHVCWSRPREAWGPQAFGPEWRCGLPPASRVYLHKPRASSLSEPPAPRSCVASSPVSLASGRPHLCGRVTPPLTLVVWV